MKDSPKYNLGAVGYLILATLLWSGNYIAGRYLAGAMPALFLNGLRWAISALLWIAIVRTRGIKVPLWREAPLLGTLGFLGMFLFSSLTYLGLHRVSAAQGGMIAGLMPIAILVFSVVLAGERPTLQGWLGVLVAVGGVGFLMSGPVVHGAESVMGELELLCAAIIWGAYTALGRRFRSRMDTLSMTAGAAMWGTLPSLIAGVISLHGATLHFSPTVWIALIYVSTASSIVAYWLWNSGVARIGATRSAPFINLIPIFTVILGLLMLHETISARQVVGGTVILAGATFAGLRPVRLLAHPSHHPPCVVTANCKITNNDKNTSPKMPT